jgi:ribosome-binding factor A
MSRHQTRNLPPGDSQRQLRVGELIRHELAAMLSRGDIHDPVVEAHMITVPEVHMSPDLRLATIYIMPLGGRDEKDVLDALDRNKRYVRGEIARRVNLKFAPEIRFRIDERFDEAERIEKLLRTPQVQRDLKDD